MGIESRGNRGPESMEGGPESEVSLGGQPPFAFSQQVVDLVQDIRVFLPVSVVTAVETNDEWAKVPASFLPDTDGLLGIKQLYSLLVDDEGSRREYGPDVLSACVEYNYKAAQLRQMINDEINAHLGIN